MKENIKDKVIAYLFGCAIGLAIAYGVIIPALNFAIQLK